MKKLISFTLAALAINGCASRADDAATPRTPVTVVPVGQGSYASDVPPEVAVILGHAAQLNPDWVAAQEDELWEKNDKVAHDNDTPGMVYYAAHSNRNLGPIAPEYSLSLPLARVYFNPRTKVTTYTVFNPTDKAQTATVYKGGKKIGVLRAALRELRAANQLDQ